MNRIIGILLFAVCANATASVDYYNGYTVSFPDETSTQGLPESFPCAPMKAFNGQTILNCAWLKSARNVSMWDAQRQHDVAVVNQAQGLCKSGKCRFNGIDVGYWNQEIPFNLSIWYWIGTSTDGKPVAYRKGVTRQVSYKEAGANLLQFYMDAGVPDKDLASTFDPHYEGGYAAFTGKGGAASSKPVKPVAVQASPPQSYPEVKSAWCNPQMDDDCSINGKPVLVADLGKYLPSVSESNVDQLGGHCETILCFDKDDQPMGYLLQ